LHGYQKDTNLENKIPIDERCRPSQRAKKTTRLQRANAMLEIIAAFAIHYYCDFHAKPFVIFYMAQDSHCYNASTLPATPQQARCQAGGSNSMRHE